MERRSSIKDYGRLLDLFIQAGAISPATAVTLGAIGREMSGRSAEYLARQECLAREGYGWWVTAVGHKAAAAYEKDRAIGTVAAQRRAQRQSQAAA